MTVLITADSLLPGPAGERVPDAAVLVRGDTITAAGRREDVQAQAPPDVRRLDCPGATLLPGLVNGHVHFSLDAGADPLASLRASDPETLAAGMAERAGQLLGCGVTTARDLGDSGGAALRLRDRIASGELPGPRVLAAAAPLTPPGGHCWFFGGEVSGEAEIRAMVRRNAGLGADVIKVMASGGQITEGGAEMWESQFSTEELAAVVDEASGHGLPVAAHAHGTEAIVSSVAAGVDTIEHCTWMTGKGKRERRPEVAEEMARRGIAVCSTNSVNWRKFAEWLGEELAAEMYGRLIWMDSLGIPLITGTDAGLRGSVFDDFTSALELYEWLDFGNDRIVELATAASADALGIGAVVGRVAPGYQADLLVVDGDPGEDLAALRAVRLVLARGREHRPGEPAMER